jgi:outer membrane protease
MRIVLLFSVFVIILFAALPVSAQINKDYSISLSPQVGVFFGHAAEIVYPTDTKAELLSQLLWDMKPVFYYGFLIDFLPARPMEKWSFFSSLSMKFGIPGPSGSMEDRDWMSKVNTELTNFSTHDNITKEILLLDFSMGVSFPFFNALFVKTFINLSYMNFHFDAENGYLTYARKLGDGIYAPIDVDPIEDTFSGTVISYSQEWFYAAPGVSVGYGSKEYFLAEIYFMISPLVFCVDHDEHKETEDHKGRNIEFMDNLRGGIMIEPGLKLFMAASKWLGISCDISWRYISGSRGPSYMRYPIGTGNYMTVGEAGAGMSVLNVALLLKVKL